VSSTQSLLLLAALALPGARIGAQEAKHMQMAMQPGADRVEGPCLDDRVRKGKGGEVE